MSEPTDLPGAVPLPEPVTFDRLTAQLDSAELNLTPAGENKLRGRWQENIIEFVLNTGKTSGRQLRSEEHTSELQSRGHLVCRLLLDIKINIYHSSTVSQVR